MNDAERIKEARTDVCAIAACMFSDPPDDDGLNSFDETDFDVWRYRTFAALQQLGALVEITGANPCEFFRGLARSFALSPLEEHDPNG